MSAEFSSAVWPDADIGSARLRLVLADDHRMLRDGLRLSMEDAGFEVVGEAGDGEEAARLVHSLRPDVVLMDVTMPVLDGIEATRLIHERHPETHVLILTMHGESHVMARAIQAGAVGYLVKDCSTEEIVAAVRLAASDAGALSSELASSMLAEVQRGAASTAGDPVISPREEEVLQLVANGLSLPEVAAELFISVKTVKNHLASIYGKLDARDRTQAVLRAVRMGIIRLD
ncbi:MAG: two-component system, NarL family, response regulator DegU [Acidimicrobiaceae bacterium]|jgi:DNA-binding NarL/FixJ family response regulator